MKELYISGSMEVEASAEIVWDYLTNPEHTVKYMYNCWPESDWETGSQLLWKGKDKDGKDVVYVKGEVVNIIPGKTLQYTVFDPTMGIEDIPENYLTVIYELTENKYSTKLDIKQGNFAAVANGENRYSDAKKGWNDFLAKLKELIEE